MTVMKYKKSIFDADPEKEWQMDELLTEEGALVDRQKKGGNRRRRLGESKRVFPLFATERLLFSSLGSLKPPLLFDGLLDTFFFLCILCMRE